MPEFIHTFQSGRMNKDLDERLIPNGEYRDALNLDLANSDGSNVGTLQNVKGNREQRGCEGCSENWSSDYIDALQNPVVIGSYRHDQTERIYWFIASDNVSAIAEYDQTTDLVKPVLVDTAGILNFSQNYLITGINILDKFLFWTDDQTEPKKINIEKFKTGSVDFTTHTKVPKWLPQQNAYQTSLTGRPDFTEKDVTVAKLSPTNAPIINATVSKFGNDVPGTGITPVSTTFNNTDLENFTYIPNPTTEPNVFISYPTYGEYLDQRESGVYLGTSLDNAANNPNYDATYGWDGHITFEISEVVTAWQIDDVVIMTGSYENPFGQDEEYSIQIQVKEINNLTITAQIQAISLGIQKTINSEEEVEPIVWECVLLEKDSIFEYKFPRFAYRWKYIDNEYSCFSPFSKVAFLGGEFEYVSSDAYNLGMVNRIKKLIIENLVWTDEEVSEIDILYKESNSTSVYVVDTLKKEDYLNVSLPSTYQIKSELIGSTVDNNQLLRPWDNVPRKAKSQEIIGNRVVYGNYLQNYNTVGYINTDSSVSTSVNLLLSSNSFSHEPIYEIGKPAPSIKSIRTYQVGVVYKDTYGRETPVFTSQNASFQLDISASSTVNKLQVTPLNVPPDWATHYKFFIKETSNEYYNLALDRFYHAEDGNIWLSFPSSERNKVDEETYLILKKQHDNDVAIKELNRYKILSISSSAPEFISTFDVFKAGNDVDLTNEIEPGRITLQFDGPTNTNNPEFHKGFTGNRKLRITTAGTTSDYYEIDSFKTKGTNNNEYEIVLKEPLGPEVPLTNSGTTVTIKIYEPEKKNLPEFEGRFFAKINRNFAFDTNIIESFKALEPRYAVRDEIDFTTTWSWGWNNYHRTFNYGDAGCDGCSDDGCTSRNKQWSIFGWSNMNYAGTTPAIGSNYTSQNAVRVWNGEGYAPPTKGRRVVGFVYTGVRPDESQTYINSMVGYAPPDIGLSRRITGGSLAEGAKIRFESKQGDQSEVYTVMETFSYLLPRGGRYKKKNCNNWRTNSENGIVIFMIFLDRAINDPWMPEWNQQSVLSSKLPSIQVVENVSTDNNKLLTSPNPAIFETEPKEAVDLDLYYEASNAIPISDYNNTNQQIDWFNCYSYGQGVESNRIRDDYNAVYIDKGPKVSTVLDDPYAEERRGSGYIFSQVYNSTSGINRLNQFIQALPITKDLNPIHGTIQKLYARDTDLITLCEDKCFRVLANKDALFNADGNVNLTGNTAVLGQAVPYVGEFGISKNPESFSQYAFRSYFTDKNRGAVIRLSRDGITNIAEKGMSDFFADNLKVSTNIIGSYDDDKDIYNVTLDNLSQSWKNTFSESQDYQLNPDCNTDTSEPITQTTVSFKESVDGWTSRKSFIQESGVSLNNRYFTFKNGRIWEHGLNVKANNFYGVQYDSAFNVIFNEMPQSVKGFSTLNYTGTQSRRLQYKQDDNPKLYSIAEINFNKIIPDEVGQKQPGWYVNYIKTDLEGGEVKEFEKKEGKYFNYIKGLEQFNDCEFIGEGIGPPVIVQCDPQSYNFTITIDESCSSSGGSTPDTTQFFINSWDNIKNDPIYHLDITSQTTAQGVKCAIEALYDLFNLNYSLIINNGTAFSYVFSDGLQVGTQMYNSITNQPISSAGAFLFVGSGDELSDLTVSHAGLDANNATAVPATYYVMILNSSGQIASWTQYNTLTTCP
jgi:hypothetical protein